jgi:predicted Zn finger-like uncharacterized protein
MDVRCESCHTEYELDDGSVSSAGTDVQCTYCGHTFTVYPTSAAAPARSATATEFLLETADGRTHRLRDFTVLQKWIIERKVTRADRISRNGQPWARLGTLEDLAPFFDVVDEADRARAAAGRGSSGELRAAGRGLTEAPLRLHAGPTTEGVRATTPEGQRAVNRSLELMAVEAPTTLDEDLDTSLNMRPAGSGWWKLIVTFGVAGAVAYVGFRALPSLMPKPYRAAVTGAEEAKPGAPGGPAGLGAERASASEPTPTAAEASAAPATAESAQPPGGGPAPAAVPTAIPTPTPAAPAPSNQPAGKPALPSESTASAPAAPESAPADKGQPGNPRAGDATPPGKTAAARTRSAEELPYDRLVAQADRLLENGANERALRVYERALAVRPDAPEALTGIGYVQLDRHRPGAAIEFFTRASSAAPFAPAVFGLAQAYLASGDQSRARQTYQRYLNLFPTGADAQAAGRQLQMLSGGGAAAPAAPADPVSVPSSILHEGGEAGRGGSAPAAPPPVAP